MGNSDQHVNVRYSGVLVSTGASTTEVENEGFFVNTGSVLPVGTVLDVDVGGRRRSMRVAAIRYADPPTAGMRLRYVKVDNTDDSAVAAAANAATEQPAAELAPTADDPTSDASPPASKPKRRKKRSKKRPTGSA